MTLFRRVQDGQPVADLVMTCHHALYDGYSGLYLLRDILLLLGQPDRPIHALDSAPFILTLIPPRLTRRPFHLAQMAVVRLALHSGLLHVLRLFWRTRLSSRRLPATSSGDRLPWQRFCVHGWSYDPAQTAALLARCRKEGTSLHAAVCVAWMRAFAETQTTPSRRRWVRTVSTPVSLRERLSRSVGESLGFFISTVETSLNCAPGRPFWTDVRRFKRRLARASQDDRVFWFMQLNQVALSSVPRQEAPAIIRELNARPVGYDFSMTNLGRLDFPEQCGPITVLDVGGPFAAGSEQERTVGTLTFRGCLHFTLTHRDFILSPEAALRLKARAMQILAEAVNA
jgi:hypothetical protein